MSPSELIPIWEADMKRLVPDFQLLQQDKMERAIDAARAYSGDSEISDLEVCVKVLRNGMENRFNGVPAAWWWITASLLILEDITSNPWYEVCWWLYENSRGKRETNTLWGAANCGKTEFFGAMSWTNMVVWSHEAYVYITSPWKTHGSDKIWSTLAKRARKWLAVPPSWMREMNLELKANADEITIIDADGNEAVARFVSLESSASVTGKKRNKTDDLFTINPKQGVMLLIADELVENPEACVQFAECESNYISNPNALGFVAFNPKPHKVQHANAMSFSAPVEVPVEVLSRDVDFTWKTARGTLIRLCIANSPNAPCGDNPMFPFLINHPQAAAQARRGELSLAAQVDAWGFGEGDNGSELTHHDCIREDRQAGPVWIAPPQRLLFTDPAFGGRDAASITCMEYGVALIEGVRRNVFSVVEQAVLPITRRWIPTDQDVIDFRRLVSSRGGSMPDNVEAGKESSASDLVVLQTLRAGARLSIPTGHITYDASQRADAALPMNKGLGRVIWYYEGTRKMIDEEGDRWKRWPTQKNPDGTTMKWSDEVSQPISMIWRFGERVISRGYVMGLAKAQRGLAELRGRRWVTRNGTGRIDVEAKTKLLVSPTYGEGLATAIYFGVRFLDALPGILSEQSGAGDTTNFSDPLFQMRPRRRLDPAIYR